MVLSVALVVAACDDAEEPLADAGFAALTDASTTDASATDAGRVDASKVDASPGPTTPGPAAPVMCGGKTCTAPQGGLIPNIACCLPDNSCGAMPDLSGFGMGVPSGGGTCLDLTPGTPDPSCPSRDAMGFPLAGCCSKAGVCGLDLSMGGLGCNAITGLSGLSPGGAVDAGSPQTCGPGSRSGDAGVDAGADAGVDAGADASTRDAAAPRDGSAADGSTRDR